MNRSYRGVFLAVALVSMPAIGETKSRNAGACAAAIGTSFFAACKAGFQTQGKTCRGALGQMRAACASLRHCRYGCHMNKRTAKKTIKSLFRSCKQGCRAAQKKRACRRACSGEKRNALRAVRHTRTQCRKHCRADYLTKACKKARGQFVAWTATLGVGSAAIAVACAP